jgi:uroporphyrinogen III methyltransferase/synthase
MGSKDKNPGTVYLIGAGPGDPDLISLKASRILKRCDVVIYDKLVPEELVITLPASVRKQYAGKIAGQQSFSQSSINELMVELAQEGQTVVRLKGGDPFVFGRGGEEAQYLKDHGISFEIVPGVTAGIAAPEYAGIPITDRRAASFVMLITGHKAANKPVSDVPWDWIGKAKDGTVVVYMGVAEIETIVNRLLESGMAPETPAAAIERGTFPTQKILTASLAQLPALVRENSVQSPVIFVIGEVVDMHEPLSWFEKKPLFGIRVMVTRPADQAEELYMQLRELGAEVVPRPTIKTEEVFDPAAWSEVRDLTAEQCWLVFTSENGVRYFISQWQQEIGDIRRLSRFQIAAVGAGTARSLSSYNLSPDFLPDEATTEALAKQLAMVPGFAGAAVVRVRGNLADDTVERILADAGASILPLPVYRTFFPWWPEEMKKSLLERPPEVILFTSGSSAEGLADILTADELKDLTKGVRVVSIGPSTSKIIRSYGMNVDIESGIHTIPAILDELLKYYEARSNRRPQ